MTIHDASMIGLVFSGMIWGAVSRDYLAVGQHRLTHTRLSRSLSTFGTTHILLSWRAGRCKNTDDVRGSVEG
jgi:hypothetical protein